MKLGRLYLGFKPTNEATTRIMASWTQPSGYWKWTLFRQPYRSWKLLYGPSFVNGTKYRPMPESSHFGCWGLRPFIGTFHVHHSTGFSKKMTKLYTVVINLDHKDMNPDTWEGGLPTAICAALDQLISRIQDTKIIELVCTDRETGEHVLISKIVDHDAPVLKTTH